MKKIEYIIMLHDLEVKESLRIDFSSYTNPDELIKNLELDGYRVSQFIQNEFLVKVSEAELRDKKIEFDILPRIKKTWFGLSSKVVNDIFIRQASEFIYPYNYGHFVYYFSKNKIGKPEMSTWLSINAQNIFVDLDDIHSAMNNYGSQLINKEDYVIVTNYDSQFQLGISGKLDRLKSVRNRIENLEVENIEFENYRQRQK